MAKREESLEDLGKREAEYEKDRAARLAEREKNMERVAKEVPERFFKLCADIRDGVRRFNENTDQNRRFTWRESAALAARDANLSGDFNCGFSRAGADVTVSLVEMSRSGRPNVYLMDIVGKLKEESFFVRVDAFAVGNKLDYRVSIDQRRMPWSIDELADRLVRAAAKTDYLTLTGIV